MSIYFYCKYKKKTDNKGKTKNTKFVGVEIQPEVAEMADRSVKLNLLEDNIEILNTNILDIFTKIEK